MDAPESPPRILLNYFVPVAKTVPRNGVNSCKPLYKTWGANSFCMSVNGGPFKYRSPIISSKLLGECDNKTATIDCIDTDIVTISQLYKSEHIPASASECLVKQCGKLKDYMWPSIPTTPFPSGYGDYHSDLKIRVAGYGSIQHAPATTPIPQESGLISMMDNGYVWTAMIILVVVYLILYKFNLAPAPPCALPCLTANEYEEEDTTVDNSSVSTPHTIVPVEYQMVDPPPGVQEEPKKKGMFQSAKNWAKKKLGRT